MKMTLCGKQAHIAYWLFGRKHIMPLSCGLIGFIPRYDVRVIIHYDKLGQE